jgi:hypothetical protein
MVAGHLFLAAAYGCAAGTGGSAVTLAGCLLLLGAFYASTDGVLAAAAAGLVEAGARGTAIATAQSVVALARLGAAVGFGWLWLALGRADAVLLMAGALVLATGAAGWLLRGAGAAR